MPSEGQTPVKPEYCTKKAVEKSVDFVEKCSCIYLISMLIYSKQSIAS